MLLGIVGVVAVGLSSAFFSDTETSQGNTFVAGQIDLGIDNHSFYNGVLNPGTTWRVDYDLSDNPPRQFFNFGDVKPGDWGEDTISLHVKDNEAWLCADVTLTSNDENGLTEPEAEDGDDTSAGTGAGELAQNINFFWWADDGDNVFETDEETLPGTGGTLGALAINATTSVALADASINIWDGSGPFTATSSTRYIAKAWCFGDISENALPQNAYNGPANNNNNDNVIDERDGGFICSGAPSANNVTQTDSMTANISFYAVQSRNNASFLCSNPRGSSSSSSSSESSSSSSSSSSEQSSSSSS